MDKLKALLTVLLCFVAACVHEGKNPYVQPKEKPVTDLHTKQVVALAFISYAGDAVDAADYVTDQIIAPCVANELQRHVILQGDYSLAWGPFVDRFADVELDDNMMYAAWNKSNPGELVVAIRGTNFGSLSDWIDEDFYVTKTVEWQAAQAAFPGARITKATDIGLTVLQNLGKSKRADTTLKDFILAQAKDKKLRHIVVTGHSLAGALAPVYALWLKESLAADALLDPVAISVVPIAGASPGNAAFAAYYDQQLGANTNRLHNPYDVVPQAWYLPSMRAIHNIYATPVSDIRPTFFERVAVDFGIGLAKGMSYQQINANQAPTWGAINVHEKSFTAQAEWQHHCGYYNALGMNTVDERHSPMYAVNTYCVTSNYCDDNEDSPMCEFETTVRCPLVPIAPLN